MATLKPTTSVPFDDTIGKESENFQAFLKNNLYKTFQNSLQGENQNFIRQLDFSSLMDTTLANNLLKWHKDASSSNQEVNDKLTNKQNNNRKSSRGSEEDPEKSGLSDFETIDEETTINNDQSAFLNSVSSISNKLSNQSQLNQFSLNQNYNEDNSTTIESNDNQQENQDSQSGDDDEFILNKLSRSQAGRRKSSSRLARQTGDGPAKKFSCHLCSFMTENKPQYNAHMDKHYEHRCVRCGYGCRTKGRLNRHIRESHPDLADELGCGDSKRKKRNFNLNKYGSSLNNVNNNKINRDKSQKNLKKEENLNGTIELSNAGSDSTIIIDQNKLTNDALDHLNNNQTNSQKTVSYQADNSDKNKQINSNQPSPSSIIPDDVSEHSQLSRSSSSFEQLINPVEKSNLLRYRRYTCKQCPHVSMNKLEFWEHNKVHIKSDKLLSCTECGFSTGYKHHLDYHLRRHLKSKPFKCIKCSYTCINKSMLASHLKSHSNVYQFRCNDCAYATKYCHSLKLHLRKYNHKPDRVLNLDGSENPYPIIDIYGTRRGPRPKKGVGSLKLVKQVLEDNDHVVVDPDKVKEIVNTLSEQNPEDGDEKLFRLMRSNEEKEMRIDMQLNYIISEQLKANAANHLNEESSTDISASIKTILNQQASQQSNQQSNQQLISKNQNLNNNKMSAKSSVQFIKERAGCSSTVLSKLSSYCKLPKKQEINKQSENTCSTNSQLNDQERATQLSRSILNNLLTEEQGLALARSLLNPSLFNNPLLNSNLLNSTLFNSASSSLINNKNLINDKEKSQPPLDSYSAHLLTNQLLQSHLIAQFKNEQQSKEVNNDTATNNFLAQIAFNLALNDQTNSSASINNNNLLLNSLNLSSQEWSDQLTNHLINQGLLNPNLFNLNLPNLLNQTFLNQNLLNSSAQLLSNNNSSSSPDAVAVSNNQIVKNENMSNSKSLTNASAVPSNTIANSMITNWQSYLTSLILNKTTNNNLPKTATSLLPNTIADNQQLSTIFNNNRSSSTTQKNLTLSQSSSNKSPLNNQIVDKKHLEEMVNQKIEEKLDEKLNAKIDDKLDAQKLNIKQEKDLFINSAIYNQKHQQHQKQTTANTIPSQPNLNLVLSSIGQVFNGKPTSCLPTSSLLSTLPNIQNLPNLSNQSSELDLSAILGYSMLMRMQQQFTASSSLESQHKKLKENSS